MFNERIVSSVGVPKIRDSYDLWGKRGWGIELWCLTSLSTIFL
jgi:hypothetical protein